MTKSHRSRYANVKRHVHPDGTKLDSGRELRRYCDLLLLQKAGEIFGLRVHPRYPITIADVPILIKSKGYPNGRHLTYVADFSYIQWDKTVMESSDGTLTGHEGERVIEDVKMESGFRTEIYKIKRALMEAMGRKITEY